MFIVSCSLRRLLLVFLSATCSLSVATTIRSAPLADNVPCVTVAQISCDEADTLITPAKVDAALVLAFDLAHRKFVGTAMRDSVLVANHVTEGATAMQAAELTGCGQMLFTNTRRFEHLVRTETQLLTVDGQTEPRRGVGYASITYARNETELIADPAILTSVQRALLQVLTPTPRYDTLSSGLAIIPANLIAVSGVAFVDSAANLAPLQLFKEHTVVSYDVALTIVRELQGVDTLVAVDLDTRDSMYAKAGFHWVDNDRPPSDVEMRVLRGFDIGRMITGKIVRTPSNVTLTLVNASLLMNGTFRQDASASVTIAADSKNALRDAVAEATHRLFHLPDSIPDK